MSDLYRLSIEEAAALLARKEISALQLTESVLARIGATDP